MPCYRSNDQRRFAVATEEKKRELAAELEQRRKEMGQMWHDLDEQQYSLDQWSTNVGIRNSINPPFQGMFWVNIGGSNFSAPVSILYESERSPLMPWSLSDLFQAEWDSRVPRSEDGFTVLDESPVCVKHLLLNKSKGSATVAAPLSLEDERHLPHVAHALGLSHLLPPDPMVLSGGSDVLGNNDLASFLAIIQRWCPGSPGEMDLLYRASLNGWCLREFHDRCDDTSSTITLVRTTSSDNSGESVIGGFSGVPMRPTHFGASGYRASPDAFLFMLKDGSATGATFFKPAKWTIKQNQARYAVQCGSQFMPRFGRDGDLKLSKRKLTTGNSTYDVPEGSPFAKLHGQAVLELEVFALRARPALLPPSTERVIFTANNIEDTTRDVMDDDAQRFGIAIADLLLEEATALQQSKEELKRACARASASASALRAIYGPRVAAGKGDPVVELSVRGTRMTTLLSTVQACPGSPLAARFDERKWPATEKETGYRGCRVINDCSPYVFSKVLDVLRIRKREAWGAAEGKRPENGPQVQVSVRDADRQPFEEFVNMYFPGNEGFIMDRVIFPDCTNGTPA